MSQEKFVIDVLDHFEIKAVKIPEANFKTPDFLVELGNDSYLIELKTKNNSSDLIAKRNKALSAGQLYEEIELLTRRNRLSGIVKSATNQLHEYDVDEESLRIVWLHCEGSSASLHMSQFEVTLYGSTTIYDFSEKGIVAECYYFHDSDFYRYRNVLDGAILTAGNELKFLLNNNSPRYECLRDGALCESLKGAICDPLKKESEGLAYIVNGSIDRRDSGAVLNYLRKKYNQNKLMEMKMNYVSAAVVVSDE